MKVEDELKVGVGGLEERRLMSKRIEVECGDEEGDTEEEGVLRGRASVSKARREGRGRGEEVEGGGKPLSSDAHPKLARKAAKKSGDGG